MKFQELLAGKQINWDRVKLIRHNLTKEEIARIKFFLIAVI